MLGGVIVSCIMPWRSSYPCRRMCFEPDTLLWFALSVFRVADMNGIDGHVSFLPPQKKWLGHQSGWCSPCEWTSGRLCDWRCAQHLHYGNRTCSTRQSEHLQCCSQMVMPILRADAKELACTRPADIQHLLQLLPGALSGAKAASTMRRYTPAWDTS